jgi:DNA invertase Pin-like site-specific DNA recombinase
MKAAAYVRVSSREQEASGLSLAAQKDASAAAALDRDWTLSHIAVEVASAGNIRRRPVLNHLLDDLDAGKYEALIVTRLDRLARSLIDFLAMLERADANGWQLVCLSPNVDMSDPYGRCMAQVAGSFAELERALISIRTREGLSTEQAQGNIRRKAAAQCYGDRETIERIVRLSSMEGWSYGDIARQLTAEGVPTRRGGAWTSTQIRRIIIREKGNIHA